MIYDKCGDELKTYKLTYPTLFEYAEALYGHVFSYGVHASGTIISDSPLRDECPLRWVAKDKKLVTQFDYRTVESLGYMKVDLLGLRNLDTLMEVNNILERDGKDKIDFPSLINQTFPDEMWEIAEKGWTVGLFQIESGGTAKRLAKEIKPRSIEDLAIITAVNRPGPLIAKADKAYVSGRNGQPVHYINDIVKECTRESFGQFIYQEQVINFFTKIGYDLMEADDVRSIMGKKKREAMKAELPRYMERAQQYMDKDTAEAVWLNIENFSKYAFNKAHSIGYGIILLWTMYAKWKYPQEFILAGLRTADKTDGHRYVDEAQRMGIAVLPPELNSSDTFAKIDGDAIRYGYSDVKGIGPAVGRWLVKNGPWKDWDEVLEKAQLDEYKATLPNGMRRMAINRGQIDTLRSFEENDGDEAKKIQLEENLLGVALSDPAARILEDHATDIATDCTAYEDLKGPGSFTVAGVIKEVKKTKTRQGAEMAWVKIEQGGSELDIAVWGTELKRLNFIWSKRKAVVIQVKVTEDNFVSLVAAKVLYSKEVKQNGRV